MSQLEDRLRRTLTSDDSGRPSADLFARVRESIDEDRHRRRARTRYLLTAAAAVTALVAAFLVLTPYENGRPAMPWWTLELFTTGVLIAMALWLGPFIKRFGRAYAQSPILVTFASSSYVEPRNRPPKNLRHYQSPRRR